MADQRSFGRDDLFAFLREYGGSLAGALSFRRPSDSGDYEPLSDSGLRRALRDSIGKSNQAARDDSRSMIPGFQPKILLARFSDSQWLRPHGSAHSTHILKPERSAAPERIRDEFYAHALARRVGLATFHSELLRSAEMTYLAIERFDRRVDDNQVVHTIHQEDAAQAIGLDWLDDQTKFQDPHRPRDSSRASAYRVAECIAMLDGTPLRDWLRQLTFRVAIGDDDGHAKNVGIIHEPGSDRLSDLYDAVPNLFQEGRITWDLAFAVDGEFDHGRLTADHLVREGTRWGLRPSDSERTVTQSLALLRDAVNSEPAPEGSSAELPEFIDYTCNRLLDGLEIGRFERRRK